MLSGMEFEAKSKPAGRPMPRTDRTAASPAADDGRTNVERKVRIVDAEALTASDQQIFGEASTQPSRHTPDVAILALAKALARYDVHQQCKEAENRARE